MSARSGTTGANASALPFAKVTPALTRADSDKVTMGHAEVGTPKFEGVSDEGNIEPNRLQARGPVSSASQGLS